MLLKIILAGDGGQGIQLMAYVICKAVFENNKHVTYIPNYGLEQRGGVSLAFIQISDKGISYPKFTEPDILVIMSDQARERTVNYISDSVKIFDIKDYASLEGLQAKNFNVFFLGLLAKLLEYKGVLKVAETLLLLEGRLKEKAGWEENKNAFQKGLDT